jgi:hypothetical protein
MYESLLLIHPDTPVTSAALAAELRRHYERLQQPATIVERGTSGLDLRFAGYAFHVDHDRSPHVLEESVDIATRFGSATGKQERIAACSSRFEVRADNDPSMNYFTDFMYIIDAAQSLGEVYAFDTAFATFL